MLFGRNSRRSSRFTRWLNAGFLPVLRVHFDTPDDPDPGTGGTGGTGGAAGTGTGNPPAANPGTGGTGNGGGDRVPDLLRERKKLRAAWKAMLRGMGLDPETVTIRNTGDASDPVRIEGIPDLDQRLALARAVGTGTGTGKKGNVSVELATAQSQRDTFKKQVDALVRYIKRTALIEPIRAECVRQHAIDDDDGRFDDIVSQLAPSGKVEIEFDTDDVTAEPEVSVYYVGADGKTPLVTQSGAPATAATLVADLLTKRPKYRQSNFRSGPGAGGSQVGTNSNGSNGTNGKGRAVGQAVTTPARPGTGNPQEDQREHSRKQVAQMFGIDPDELQ